MYPLTYHVPCLYATSSLQPRAHLNAHVNNPRHILIATSRTPTVRPRAHLCAPTYSTPSNGTHSPLIHVHLWYAHVLIYTHVHARTYPRYAPRCHLTYNYDTPMCSSLHVVLQRSNCMCISPTYATYHVTPTQVCRHFIDSSPRSHATCSTLCSTSATLHANATHQRTSSTPRTVCNSSDWATQ
ncbi:hypothetical protein Pcinc_004501 [Petrolisthes cinctipes]|uniref:Uncharacterized protein n=1 Tax=Petrolisthes cinctipes TaxID=88211 RepID=A0AAE1GEE8_PETCI|nr:hypothetical protein Pcinc_004501 [Petrolisthes cinctipes]